MPAYLFKLQNEACSSKGLLYSFIVMVEMPHSKCCSVKNQMRCHKCVHGITVNGIIYRYILIIMEEKSF